jgi:hypothetical protein
LVGQGIQDDVQVGHYRLGGHLLCLVALAREPTSRPPQSHRSTFSARNLKSDPPAPPTVGRES